MKANNIVELKRVEEVNYFETKIGGTPDWLNSPQYPISSTWGKPMMFFGQINLNDFFDFDKKGMAYIFFSHAESKEDTFFNVDSCYYDSGENAVIIQWQNEDNLNFLNKINIVESVEALPILFDDNGYNPNFIIKTEKVDNYEFKTKDIICQMDDESIDAYCDNLWSSKIIGTPHFVENDELIDDYRQLLIQIHFEDVPAILNPSGGTLYVFIDDTFSSGKMFIQTL